MPNSAHSSPTASLLHKRRRTVFASIQTEILQSVSELRRLDRRLFELSASLPNAHHEFEARAELGGTVDCVRIDLLADTIETLTIAASAIDSDLRFRFTERAGLLAAVEA